jgi:hypothetical protein
MWLRLCSVTASPRAFLTQYPAAFAADGVRRIGACGDIERKRQCQLDLCRFDRRQVGPRRVDPREFVRAGAIVAWDGSVGLIAGDFFADNPHGLC